MTPDAAPVAVTFGPATLLVIAVVVGLVSLPVTAIIDAARRPPIQWERVGVNRTAWIALMAGGTLLGCGVLGVAIAAEYLISVRPKLQLAADIAGD